MLNPKKKTDHLIYGDILTAPAEYPNLEKAIATTYSLDISALVSCMIPLAFSDDVNSNLFKNKVSTLTALRNISEKLVVFCDPGQIKTLNTRNQEFAILLEKMIVPIQLEKVDNIYPSFHPKMWLLQFSNEKREHFYRLIILSKNISYDKCYDVSIVLESNTEKRGKGATEKAFKKTKNLLSYLKYLQILVEKEISTEQKTILEKMFSEIEDEQVGFNIDHQSKLFEEDDWDIYPIYKDTFRKDRKLFEKTILSSKEGYKKILIMSPFVSDDILKNLQKSLVGRKTSEKRIKFITRQDSVNKLMKTDYDDIEFYTINSNILSGNDYSLEDRPEDDQEIEIKNEEVVENNNYDIHAKFFLTETNEKKELFFGSANATNSAFNRNNELIIRLSSKSNFFNVNNFFKELNTDKGNMFLLSENKVTSEEDILQKKVEQIMREICHIKAKGNVIKTDEKYSVQIDFENDLSIDDVEIFISTLYGKHTKDFNQQIYFENLEVTDISEFYCLKVKCNVEDKEFQLERLIKIPTENIPYEERDSLLINQIITDKETFTEYVTLLLSQDSISTQLELSELKQISSKWNISNTQMPLYETLLKASVLNPSSVLALKKDIDLIQNKEVVSEEFKQLYEEFRLAIEGQ